MNPIRLKKFTPIPRQISGYHFFIFGIFLLLITHCGQQTGSQPEVSILQQASELLSQIKVNRGICVVLGDEKCEISRALIGLSELIVYQQFENDSVVQAARMRTDKADLYGKRIYIEKGDRLLHLADNLADAVIDLSNGQFSREEILRVLRPDGIAIIAGKPITKPFPEGIDDWSHPFHRPDNNPQSEDKLALAPYLTQFLAEPRYAPATQIAVAAGGRIFKGFGNIAFKEREEPWLNQLVAFNGYNGTLLWKRDLTPGIMLHRNMMIATPEILYFGDHQSCKIIDTETGQLLNEIIPPIDVAGGTFWKWMGLEDGILYALIGDQEPRDPVMRWRRQQHGWPWDGISPGYNQSEHPWGFGQNFLAIDPTTKKVKWHYHETEPVDSRGVCMKNGRIFLFRFGTFLTCLNAENGKVLWRKTRENAPEFFDAFGEYLTRQGAGCNWRTRDYVLCSDDAIYFAGPQIDKLMAVSTEDGRILWENEYNNFQLILHPTGLYGISADWGVHESKKFDPLTGEVLATLPTSRRACTRPNGTLDALFFRADEGTVRLDITSGLPQWISPMRPPCHDGVTIAHGMLYWWPYVCDCQLSIYGVTGVCAAGDFDFQQAATVEARLEKCPAYAEPVSPLLSTAFDWPTFRKDNQGRVSTRTQIDETGRQLWIYVPNDRLPSFHDILGHAAYPLPTPPVTVDGLVFFSGSDGIIRALDVNTGQLQWTNYTGGAVTIAPTVWRDRVFVGSADGWVYCFKARTGDQIWRFRAAPVERKIPVYGSLQSTWPAASGVVVADGVAYVAAGIVNYDGTHVYALNAETGEIIWQNSSSGHLDSAARTGVSVQGHMLIHDGKLYLASGTSLSPAIFDLATGKCLNDPEPLKKCEARSPRGWELYQIGDKVVAAGKPFYSHPKHTVYNTDVSNKMLHVPAGDRDLLWVNQQKVSCYKPIPKQLLNECVADVRISGFRPPVWNQLERERTFLWEYNCSESVALAVCGNAVVVGEKTQLVVLDIATGKIRWSVPLEYPPVPWGLAISRDGRIVVALENGSIQAFGGKQTAPTPYLKNTLQYFIDSSRVEIACEPQPTEIRYTLDGSEPSQESQKYTGPLFLNRSGNLLMRAYAGNQAPGLVVRRKFTQVAYPNLPNLKNVIPGLPYKYYDGLFRSVLDMNTASPVRSGLMPEFDLPPGTGVEEYGLIFEGSILIPQDGSYTFYVASNDGSRLWIDGNEIINNDGGHVEMEKAGKIDLKAGEHAFVLKYSQQGGRQALRVSWDGPGFVKKELNAAALFHRKSGKRY